MKRFSRILIACGLVVLALPLFLSSASAVTTKYNKLGKGLVVFGTTGPYEQAMIQETEAGPTYCVSIDTPIYPGDLLDEGSFAEAVAAAPGGELTVANLKTIYRIVLNAYPNENPSFPIAGNEDQKAASVQSAIWSFSNNWELDPANLQNDATVIANYNLIRGWVDGDSANGEYPTYSPDEPAASLIVDPTSANATTDSKAGPFTIKIQDGTSKVKVTVTNGVAVDSADNPIDTNYEYSNNEQFYIKKTSAGTANASIEGVVTSPPGRVFIPQIKGHQLLVALKDFEGTSTASATAEFEDPSTTTTTTTTQPEVLGTQVTRPLTDTGVQVKGTSVSSGTLAATGLNGMSYSALAIGFAMVALGLTISSLKKLGEIKA